MLDVYVCVREEVVVMGSEAEEPVTLPFTASGGR